MELAAQARQGAVVTFDGVALGSINMVINLVKLESSFNWLRQQGYESRFFEEMVG